MPTTPYRPLAKENNYADSYTQLDNGTVAKNVILYEKDGTTNQRATVTTNGAVLTQNKEVVPTDATKVNASQVLAYDESGNLTTITKVINSISYVKTLTYTEGVLTDISAWVQL